MYMCVELVWFRGMEFHCRLMKWSIPINANFEFTDDVKKALIYMLFIVPMKYIDKKSLETDELIHIESIVIGE